MSIFKEVLSGQNALITGAGSGNGREIALALAGGGASVAVNDINIERAETVAEQIEARGGRAVALQADASNRFQAANMIEQTRDAFGRIDVLVNAAEVFHPEPLLTIDEWNWRRQLEVNITGAFFCLQLTARVMADEGGGAIINMAAEEALNSTIPSGIGYLAGKAGLIAMTRQAARELAPQGIRVNAIATRQQSESEGRRRPSEASRATLNAFDGGMADIGSAALFLCSDAAHEITGEVLIVNQ
ncbi:MAG: SDR family NAD(P)-dependent oxidoreductase [Chloroflexi bacterium]|nr:SDR family NAD(P)-dependent oxidoreductase [Chloroflexota bacterium]